MIWSFQLTPWALPSLLALLLVVRDAGFLWPRRREGGAAVLLGLAALVGLWAVLDVLQALSPSLEVQWAAERAAFPMGAATALVWAVFALGQAGHRRPWASWPFALGGLMLLGLAAAAAALPVPGFFLAAFSGEEVTGTLFLELEPAIGHWGILALRTLAVLGSTAVLARHLGRAPGFRIKALLAAAAGAIAAAPPLVAVAPAPTHLPDLSSTGFALGLALLVAGLVRPRIHHLGPVDREVVLRELHDPLVVMDGRGRIVDANRAARQQLGLIPYADVPLALGKLWATGPTPKGAPPPRLELPHTEAGRRIYEVALTPLGDGSSRRSALLLRDVTVQEGMRRELEKANVELERLARTDALTGLANRRRFMEALETEVERSRRYGRPLSVVLLDLDRFKQVNDAHGHAAGDAVLKEAAQALRSVCRDVDLAARIGGEELALLLPETDTHGARTVAERVRERIEDAPHRAPSGDPFRVTASLGVATADGESPGGEALLQEADEALYRAKEGGRNRVVAAG